MTPARVLAFERTWHKYPGARDRAIREAFGVSSVAYSARLSEVLADPASLAVDAVTVRRLQRLRAARAGLRSARRLDSRG